jgi:hypothetical protein
MVARKLKNWIEGFEQSVSNLPSPTLFRKWAGISAVAGALERKVWVHTYGSNLYPTLYVVLVGRPGVGKTVLSKRVHQLWVDLPEHHVASSNLTKAALADELEEARRSVLTGLDQKLDKSGGRFNSLKICCNELGQLMPQYSSEMLNFLTDVYDGERYTEKRRGRKDIIHVERPQINILACTTPSYLREFLHEGAWEQGFTSRVFFIYSSEVTIQSLFAKASSDANFDKRVLDDLKDIGKLYGEMKFTDDAALEIDHWHLRGGPPRPEHPRLTHYNTRRSQHLLKLCMVASAAESNDRIITRTHVRTARGWLVEAERFMPLIFKAMNTGGTTQVIQDAWYHVTELYAASDNTPVPEADVYRFLQSQIPDTWQVSSIFQTMVKAGIITRKDGGYVPAERKIQM